MLDDPHRHDVLDGRLPLDARQVARVVAGYEREAVASQPGLTMTAAVDGKGRTDAVVQARRTVRLPFLSWFGIRDVVVRATGKARSPVIT